MAITRTKRDQTETVGAAGLNFIGCVFDGSLLGPNTTSCGGFVGWTETATMLNFTDCVFAPANVTVQNSGSSTFARVRNSASFHSTNSYYKQTFNTAQGKQWYRILVANAAEVENAGAATEYNVSGITSYGTGILYDGVLYAGADEEISLNLSGSTNYKASAGTLSGSSNPHTLTMPASDVVIYGAAQFATEPSAKELLYSGSAQELVNAGVSTDGTVEYRLGGDGAWSSAIPSQTDHDTYTVFYRIIGDATHADNAGSSVSVTIQKAASSITAAPTAVSGLMYNGEIQTLINAGTATGGEIQYKLNDGAYSTALPTATDEGNYTVYYKVVGDANHNDVAEASIQVSIAGSLVAHENTAHTGEYYTTFYHGSTQYELPAGVEAYVAAKSGEDLLLTLIAQEGDVLPANTAVVFRADAGSIALIPSDAEPVTFEAENQLQGVDAATAAPANCYVLSGHSSDNSVTGVGFYQFAGTIPAHKAYLTINGGAAFAPKRLRFVFNNAQITTGMESIQPSVVSSQKVLRDGQLIIIRNGVEYNANGQLIK